MNENSYRTVKAVLATITLALLFIFTFTSVDSFLRDQRLRDNQYFCNGAPITVKDGDTLFWITRKNCDGNFMNALDEVVSFYGSDLQVGDVIYLPTHFPCELRFTDGGQVMEDC
jgi:hypothetical protein